MKQSKKPKPTKNQTDWYINQLECELDKYTHYSRKEMEDYYFKKRLRVYLGVYQDYIKSIASQVKAAASSFEVQKKLNKELK